MKQPDGSHEYIRSVVQQERKKRRRTLLMRASGLFLISLLLLTLLIFRSNTSTPPTQPLPPTPSAYHSLKLDAAAPAKVRQLLQAGKQVVIRSEDTDMPLDTIRDMAAYFAFFRQQYLDTEQETASEK